MEYPSRKRLNKRASTSIAYVCKLDGFSLQFLSINRSLKFTPGKGSKHFSETKKTKILSELWKIQKDPKIFAPWSDHEKKLILLMICQRKLCQVDLGTGKRMKQMVSLIPSSSSQICSTISSSNSFKFCYEHFFPLTEEKKFSSIDQLLLSINFFSK